MRILLPLPLALLENLPFGGVLILRTSSRGSFEAALGSKPGITCLDTVHAEGVHQLPSIDY